MKIRLQDALERPIAYMIKAKISEFLQKQDEVKGFHCDIPLRNKEEEVEASKECSFLRKANEGYYCGFDYEDNHPSAESLECETCIVKEGASDED